MNTAELDRRIADSIIARDKKIEERQNAKVELTHRSIEFMSHWFGSSFNAARIENPDVINTMSDENLKKLKAEFAELLKDVEVQVLKALDDEKLWSADYPHDTRKRIRTRLGRVSGPLGTLLKEYGLAKHQLGHVPRWKKTPFGYEYAISMMEPDENGINIVASHCVANSCFS